ncbi:hypothetical protein U9M48_016875 [Paspalum notatum var. saurae]|uniref:Uncharacterized protein n=1 Tax=Paspalum notatum var. saurae TaxID=547442 RepID=A0AAQ3T708_PASNO
MEIRAPPTSLRLAPPPASASFRRTALRTPFLNGSAFRATCGKFGLLHHLATASTSNSDEAWLRADFCVRGWMYSTVSDAVLNLAMTDDKRTASALWAAIGAVFRANKAPRAIFLNHEFHSMTQGDLSIDAYCVRMKEKADERATSGSPSTNPTSSSTCCEVSTRSTPTSPTTSPGCSPSPSLPPGTSSSSKSCARKTRKKCAPPPPSRLLPPLMAVTNSSSCRAAGVLTPSRLASSPSHTPPAATNAFPGASIPGPANVWHPESASPLPDNAAGRFRRPRRSRRPGRAQPGHTRASPQANTAFAPLRTSSAGSNTWDATGLIAALQDMQSQATG